MSYVIHGCAGSDSWSIYQGGIHIFTGSKQACLDYLDLLASFLMTIYRVKYYDHPATAGPVRSCPRCPSSHQSIRADPDVCCLMLSRSATHDPHVRPTPTGLSPPPTSNTRSVDVQGRAAFASCRLWPDGFTLIVRLYVQRASGPKPPAGCNARHRPGPARGLHLHTTTMTTNAQKVEAILYQQAERCQTRDEALFIIRQLKALREAQTR